jgi:hypothetical protein
VLDVDVELDIAKTPTREVGEGLVQPDLAVAACVEHGVRDHELAAPLAHVELDHIDPDVERRIEGLEAVRRRERAGAAMSDSHEPQSGPRLIHSSPRRDARLGGADDSPRCAATLPG